MRDQIALITNDGHGNPSPGRSLHFVRFSDNPHMHAVNQMSAGGRLPYYDCAPAAALSRLLDDGRGSPMPTVESFMFTNNSYGTSLANLQSGLRRLGYACHLSPTPPSPGYVMNSAWGGIIAPAQCGPYIAYSTHETVIIDTPGAWEPGITTDTENDVVIVVAPADIGIWLLSGSMYVHIDTPAVVASFQAAGVKTVTVDATMHNLLVAASESRVVPSVPAAPLRGVVGVTGSLTVG